MPLYSRFDIFKNLDGFKKITFNEKQTITYLDESFPSCLLNQSQGIMPQNLQEALAVDFYNDVRDQLNFLKFGGLSNFFIKMKSQEEFQVLLVSFSDANSMVIGLGVQRCADVNHAQPIVPILLHAINGLSEGIVITDRLQSDDPIIYVNDSLCELTGYSHKEFLGNNCRFISQHPNNKNALSDQDKNNIRLALEEGRRIVSTIYNYKKNGEKFYNELSLTPVKNNAHEVTNFIGIQRDCTTAKNLEINKLLLIQELQQSNFQLDQFANIAAHDLKTPLAKAINYLFLMEEKISQENSQLKNLLNHAIKFLLKLQDLTQSILQDCKSNTHLSGKKQIHLDQVLHHALDGLSQLINESEARIEYCELPVVFGNEAQLTRVFMNTIGNSIKYRSNATPIIKINSHLEGDFYYISISDNGIGVPEEQREFVLGFLKKLNNNPDSNGIGLSICRTIIHNMGGEIWIEDSELGGTKLIFTIPHIQKDG